MRLGHTRQAKRGGHWQEFDEAFALLDAGEPDPATRRAVSATRLSGWSLRLVRLHLGFSFQVQAFNQDQQGSLGTLVVSRASGR